MVENPVHYHRNGTTAHGRYRREEREKAAQLLRQANSVAGIEYHSRHLDGPALFESALGIFSAAAPLDEQRDRNWLDTEAAEEYARQARRAESTI